jgi:hypothetical protein
MVTTVALTARAGPSVTAMVLAIHGDKFGQTVALLE